MTPELTALALAALLQYVQFVFMAVAVNRDVGASRLAGPRDDGIEIRGIIAGRLKRAFDNHFEGLILFTIAVVVVTLGGNPPVLLKSAPGFISGPGVLMCLPM